MRPEGLSQPGYLSERYPLSFAGEYRPVPLPNSGGWLLERPIPNTGFYDLVGCYPLFCCRDWSYLQTDLNRFSSSHVSATFVADTFIEEVVLRSAGLDVVRPYKPHHIVDFRAPIELPRKHRRNIERALACLEIRHCADPLKRLDEWCALYDQLILKHVITGMATFSRDAFKIQLSMPGMVMFEAVNEGTTVGMSLWCEQNNFAYGHLGATNARGYETMASYALYATAIAYFADRVAAIDLGGVSDNSKSDGLDRFKKGWSNSVRFAFLCGKQLNPSRYRQLSARAEREAAVSYFPAYRAPRF